jgi:hypothetical protein
VQVGRSFFTPPRDQVLELGDGLQMWYGFFQSAILGWKPFVNIDGEYIKICLYFLRIYCHSQFKDPLSNGTSITSASQILVVYVLVLLLVENYKGGGCVAA